MKSLFLPLILAASAGQTGGGHRRDAWLQAGRTLDETATIYLNKAFGTKSGTFRTEPDSLLEKEGTFSGSLLVGTYRFVYDKPIEELGITFDELISVEVLDCRRSYFGTLKRTQKLNGRKVGEYTVEDGDVVLHQTTIPSVGAQLCDVHDGKPPRRLK
jgi:hypothetical protein